VLARPLRSRRVEAVVLGGVKHKVQKIDIVGALPLPRLAPI